MAKIKNIMPFPYNLLIKAKLGDIVCKNGHIDQIIEIEDTLLFKFIKRVFNYNGIRN